MIGWLDCLLGWRGLPCAALSLEESLTYLFSPGSLSTKVWVSSTICLPADSFSWETTCLNSGCVRFSGGEAPELCGYWSLLVCSAAGNDQSCRAPQLPSWGGRRRCVVPALRGMFLCLCHGWLQCPSKGELLYSSYILLWHFFLSPVVLRWDPSSLFFQLPERFSAKYHVIFNED